jgi:hypothetical protein
MKNKILLVLIVGTVGAILIVRTSILLLAYVDHVNVHIDPSLSETSQSHIQKACTFDQQIPFGLLKKSLFQLRTEIPVLSTVTAWHTKPHVVVVYVKAHEPIALTAQQEVILEDGNIVSSQWFDRSRYESLPIIYYQNITFPLSTSLVNWIQNFCANALKSYYRLMIVDPHTFVLQSLNKPYVIVCNDTTHIDDDIKNRCEQLVSFVYENKAKCAHQKVAADIRFAHQIVVYPVNEKGGS